MIYFYLFFAFSAEEEPEEFRDNRPLYEKLKEQKDRKQEDFEEQFKFSEYSPPNILA